MRLIFFKGFKYIAMVLLLLLLGLIVLGLYIKHTDFIRLKIIDTLKAQNITVTSLEIQSIGLSQAVFNNIRLTGNSYLSIYQLRIQYSIPGLIIGRLQLLEADGAQINIYKEADEFTIGGLESFLSTENTDKKAGFYTDTKFIKKLLPAKIKLKNFNISIKDQNTSLLFPLNISLDLDKMPKLSVQIPAIDMKVEPYQLITGKIVSDVVLDDNKWQGIIAANSLNIKGLDYQWDPLDIKMNVILDETSLSLNATADNPQKTIYSNFDVHIPVVNPANGSMHINHVKFPVGEGLVSSSDIRFGFSMKEPISFSVNFLNLDLKDILDTASKGKIKGKGKISGSFPIVYNSDGSFIVKGGQAQEEGGGIISVSPEILSGDSKELTFARTAMENFHYTKIKISVSYKDNKEYINLKIEGKNPEAKEGRAVKLNVSLTGDIFSIIQQSLIPLNDVKKLLTRGKE